MQLAHFSYEKLNGRNHLGELNMDGRIQQEIY